jgi:hypothetical protein
VFRILAVVLALVLIPFAIPERAFAQADQAARLKAEGDSLMGEIKYQQALEKYEQAYKLSADPALLYNQGRALEALSRYPEALEKLRAFDAKAPPDLHARVPNLKKLIDDIAGRTTLLTVEVAQKGATIRLGNTVLGTSPLAETRVNSGKVKIEVSLEGYETATREVDLPGGAQKKEAFTLISRDKTAVLAIDSPVKGATIRIDGGAASQVPTEVRLVPGKHTVSLTAEGYDDNTVEVVLKPSERRQLTIEPGESPVYERWWFWTIGGAVLVGAGASVLAYALLTEGEPDEGSIPPCQLRVNATGEECNPTTVEQALRHGVGGSARLRRGTVGEPGAFPRGFTIGPVPVLTVRF